MSTAYDGYALVAFPSDVKLTFLRLCQRGSIHRQDICVAQLDEDQLGSIQEDHVTHQWGEDVLALEEQSNRLQTDFGPAGGRHFIEVNLRGAYESTSFCHYKRICSHHQHRNMCICRRYTGGRGSERVQRHAGSIT